MTTVYLCYLHCPACEFVWSDETDPDAYHECPQCGSEGYAYDVFRRIGGNWMSQTKAPKPEDLYNYIVTQDHPVLLTELAEAFNIRLSTHVRVQLQLMVARGELEQLIIRTPNNRLAYAYQKPTRTAHNGR